MRCLCPAALLLFAGCVVRTGDEPPRAPVRSEPEFVAPAPPQQESAFDAKKRGCAEDSLQRRAARDHLAGETAKRQEAAARARAWLATNCTFVRMDGSMTTGRIVIAEDGSFHEEAVDVAVGRRACGADMPSDVKDFVAFGVRTKKSRDELALEERDAFCRRYESAP